MARSHTSNNDYWEALVIRRLTTALAVLVVVLGVLLPPASAMEEVSVSGGVPGWVDPQDPNHQMYGGFILDVEGLYADFWWQGTTSLGDGNFAQIDFDGYYLDPEPCTGERRVPYCMHGTFTHDHMSTAKFYMNARGTQYGTSHDDGSHMQISGSFKVWISWTGTGTVRKTINSDGSVTRTRDAVIDLRATFKDVVLVDATGLSGSFPSVERCCV
jgi:hypothetical protein